MRTSSTTASSTTASSTTASSTTDVAEYLDAAGGHLRSDPVAHSVLLTTPLTRPEPVDPGVPNLWCWAEQDGQVVAAAQHTPPHGAYVSTGDAAGLTSIAVSLHRLRPDVPGVGGTVAAVDAFTAGWPGVVGDQGMARHMYVCGDVVPAPPVPGALRLARQDDVDLLRTWVDGFNRDAHAPPSAGDDVSPRIAAKRLWVWEVDETPVSMAAIQVPVAGAVRVSLVYTPPGQRRRGWAAACVAGVTSLQLEQGLVAMLYADAANPTSNGVYTRIGYRHVTDAVDRHLSP